MRKPRSAGLKWSKDAGERNYIRGTGLGFLAAKVRIGKGWLMTESLRRCPATTYNTVGICILRMWCDIQGFCRTFAVLSGCAERQSECMSRAGMGRPGSLWSGPCTRRRVEAISLSHLDFFISRKGQRVRQVEILVEVSRADEKKMPQLLLDEKGGQLWRFISF